jgi:selenide, water dikinase
MGPGDLSKALAPLSAHRDPRVIVGLETFDDAGIFRLTSDVALVQTVDFFAPIVDDPFEFGQVAAANALSDVYAMGGEPLTALCIVGFPSATLPVNVLTEILRGGREKVHEAGAVIVGGHTIIDEELKFGLSVTGRVHPERLLTNAAARPGDILVLTKPIGTGLVATAVKRGIADPAHERGMIASMITLNREAARAALEVGALCATDVTGFGLLGHASHVARASGVTVRINASAVPQLAGAGPALAAGVRTGGAERNDAFLAVLVHWGNTTPVTRALLIDPQTSGGLLVALRPETVADYVSRLPGAAVVGECVPRTQHLIEVEE